MQILGMLTALLIPAFGFWWYGTRFTSAYSFVRAANGLWCVECAIMHLGLATWLAVSHWT
jgi:hypothetical protein